MSIEVLLGPKAWGYRVISWRFGICESFSVDKCSEVWKIKEASPSNRPFPILSWIGRLACTVKLPDRLSYV